MKLPKNYQRYLRRFFFLSLFIGFDIVLGLAFLKEAGFSFEKTQPIFSQAGLKLPTKLVRDDQTSHLTTVDTNQLIDLINKLRQENQIKDLQRNPKLDQVAELMIEEFSNDQFEIDQKNYDQVLAQKTEQLNYPYQMVGNSAIIGPNQPKLIFDIWTSSPEQKTALINQDYQETGAASKIIDLEGQKSVITVQVFAQKKEKQEAVISVSTTPSPVPTPISQSISSLPQAQDIPDWEVVNAINQYRADHQVHQLIVDNNLCKYAEKRVQDLIDYGGLDGHEGFKKDFEDYENMPESIKAYSGGTIGENLASQYCINGTTEETFVANTGTALIEWCFDSSVKGHREAQLNPRYNAVCVRHGKNMYVVIFGE